MFFRAQNCPILIAGREIIANSSDVSLEASLTPQYKVGQKATYDFSPSEGINGQWRMSYFWTGQDILSSYTTSEAQISGYFAGMAISGYLTDYSVKIQPNAPIESNATISFWNPIIGTPTGFSARQISNISILNASDVTFDFIDEKISGKILDYNFSYSRSYEPYYNVDSEFPYRIAPKEISVQTTLGIEKSLVEPLYSGEILYLKANIRDKNSALIDSFVTSGVLQSKSFAVGDNAMARTEIGIIQTINQPAPSISSISVINVDESTTFSANNTISEMGGTNGYKSIVVINGQNLDLVTAVYLQDRPCETFSVNNPNRIDATVPNDIISGFVNIESFAGLLKHPTQYRIQYLPMSITDFSPKLINSGELVTILGENLNRVSEVRFGAQTGIFNSINSNTITAYSPNAASGYISVVSTGRSQIATSVDKFYSKPIVTNLVPYTGWAGNTVIVSGYGLAKTTEVYFNDINAGAPSSILDNTFSITVPTGNSFGYVKIIDSNLNTVYSQQQFFPTVNVTGLIPTGAKLGDSIIITGQNIKEPLLAAMGGNGGYLVDFAGVASTFKYVGDALSGTVPTGIVGNSGMVYLYRADLSSVYESGVSFALFNSAPIITDVRVPALYSGQTMYMSLIGNYLNDVTKVTMTGIPNQISLVYSDVGFDISSSYLNEDLLGNKVNISFPLVNIGSTGKYLPIAYNDAGNGYASIFKAVTIYSGLS